MRKSERGRAVFTRRSLRTSLLLCVAALIAPPAFAQSASVQVVDKTYDVGAGAFAYTEYELSGEPLAESLGLNLEVLKPDMADKPDPFDFAAGIDSYEYSEEAMYAVDYQSQLGPHLANGPANAKRGGGMEDLGKRVIHLAQAVGLSPDELPQNIYPITFPLSEAKPEFGQPVDVASISTDQIAIRTHTGKEENVKTLTPAYLRDYKSLAWTKDGLSQTTSPLAIGGEMLKDVMWAQDFLGAMHVTASDKEIEEVASADMDHDGKTSLGKSAADGINGMLLTEITWDKLLMLRDRFGYDGKTLGVPIDANYDARKHPIWFPDQLAVGFDQKSGVNDLSSLKAVRVNSSLRSAWMLLWALGEMYGFSDQRAANANQRKAFLAVFDGDPFPAAPPSNRGLDLTKYGKSDDPFSLAALLSNMEFQNLDVLHFNQKTGAFVDDWSAGEPTGNKATTFDGAYSLVALQIYQRALRALPVGYASASSGKPLDSPASNRAGALIAREADFILKNVIGSNGLAADFFTVGEGASSQQSLGTQFAVIRGLSAAFVATGDEKYRTAARRLYLAVDKRMFDQAAGVFSPVPGKPFVVTPWTQGAVSGGLRELMTTLASRESETEPALSLANLTTRYANWFHVAGRGAQLAEWLNDTGEHLVQGGDGDLNQNGVKTVTMAGGKYGTAAVMAAKIQIAPGR